MFTTFPIATISCLADDGGLTRFSTAIAATFPPPTEQTHINLIDSRSDHSKASSSVTSSNPSINAFRERLAAAKEKQAATKFSSGEFASPAPSTSASTRAAALRARLQAVKKQTQL